MQSRSVALANAPLLLQTFQSSDHVGGFVEGNELGEVKTFPARPTTADLHDVIVGPESTGRIHLSTNIPGIGPENWLRRSSLLKGKSALATKSFIDSGHNKPVPRPPIAPIFSVSSYSIHAGSSQQFSSCIPLHVSRLRLEILALTCFSMLRNATERIKPAKGLSEATCFEKILRGGLYFAMERKRRWEELRKLRVASTNVMRRRYESRDARQCRIC